MSSFAAVVVTHNNESTIKRCLDSLKKYGISKCVVVDNDSKDDT